MNGTLRDWLMAPIRRHRALHYFLRNLAFAPSERLAAERARRRLTRRAEPAVFIVGCSRSGTSFTARMLNAAGLLLPGEHAAADDFNPDGYFEGTQVVAVNSDILWGSGGHWFTPPEALRIYAYQRAQIVQVLASLCGHAGVVGWKDPRGALTMPAWLDAARELNIPFHIVGVFRSPAAAASSIVRHERGVVDLNQALRAWRVSNTRLLELAEAYPDRFSWSTIDQPGPSVEANLNAIAGRLGLPGRIRLDRNRQSEARTNIASFNRQADEIYQRLRKAHAAQQGAVGYTWMSV